MPQSGLNIGSDARFDIITSAGLLILPTLLNLKSKKLNQKLTVKPLNGLPIHLNFQENGWEGSFDVSRVDGTLDSYFAQYEANYYAGIAQPSGTIQQTIANPDGSFNVFQFQGVVLYYDDAGDYEAEKNVIQKVSFAASTRIQLA
jgi:hypothetical protein